MVHPSPRCIECVSAVRACRHVCAAVYVHHVFLLCVFLLCGCMCSAVFVHASMCELVPPALGLTPSGARGAVAVAGSTYSRRGTEPCPRCPCPP